MPPGKLAIHLFCTRAERGADRLDHGPAGGEWGDFWEWVPGRSIPGAKWAGRYEFRGGVALDPDEVTRFLANVQRVRVACRVLGLRQLPPEDRGCFCFELVRVTPTPREHAATTAAKRATVKERA